MLRRLSSNQPKFFEFTKENLVWAKEQIKKYPSGRQASAVIPILWRAQEQEGWISKPAIDYIAELLNMSSIRVFEVVSFYFMFHLHPVGNIAHVQICGTTPCMLRGSEDIVEICKKEISSEPHTLSEDGKFSWEEVECLGACANAPLVQLGKDYYEDLTKETFLDLLADLKKGIVPQPGSRIKKFSCEPSNFVKSKDNLNDEKFNASVQLAVLKKDTLEKISGKKE